MNITTVAEYRTQYANKYGVQFPLTDTDVETAIQGAGTKDSVYPFDPDVLDLMKSAADAAVGG